VRLTSGEQLQARVRGQCLDTPILEENDSGEIGRAAAQVRGPLPREGVSVPELGSASAQCRGPAPERGASGEDSTRVID
jgi:hypothetical protein